MTTICRHIHTNGERCGSPALRTNPYCYFHRSLRNRHSKASTDLVPTIIHPLNPNREPHLAESTSVHLDLPPLEDRESIQFACSLVIGALAHNRLDSSRARTLLYGLQVASANAVRLRHSPSTDYLVTETVLTPTGEEMAPDEDPRGEIKFQEFLNSYRDEDDEEDEDDELEAS